MMVSVSGRMVSVDEDQLRSHVPEPATWIVLLIGLMSLLFRRKTVVSLPLYFNLEPVSIQYLDS
jgi:hypothetical protein